MRAGRASASRGATRRPGWTASTSTPLRSTPPGATPRRRASTTGSGVHHAEVASAEAGVYDLVCAFECVHDMPDPVSVLAAMRRAVAPGGTVLIMDEKVAEAFAPDGDEVERLFYGFSLMCCLPDGLSADDSVGTGTVMRRSTLEEYARAAGFSGVEVLDDLENDIFRFYRLRH
ncbi:class I SAM-dependent methyltransferase [Actinomycetospora sp. NBC_00405]